MPPPIPGGVASHGFEDIDFTNEDDRKKAYRKLSPDQGPMNMMFRGLPYNQSSILVRDRHGAIWRYVNTWEFRRDLMAHLDSLEYVENRFDQADDPGPPVLDEHKGGQYGTGHWPRMRCGRG